MAAVILTCLFGAAPAVLLAAWLTIRPRARQAGLPNAAPLPTDVPVPHEVMQRGEGRVRLPHRALERAVFVSLAVVAGVVVAIQLAGRKDVVPVLVGAFCAMGTLWWVVHRGAFLPIARAGGDEIDLGSEGDDHG